MPVPKQRKPSLASQIAAVVQQRGESKYYTTATSCTCPDHKFRGRVCKHMLSVKAPRQPSAEVKQLNEDMENFF